MQQASFDPVLIANSSPRPDASQPPPARILSRAEQSPLEFNATLTPSLHNGAKSAPNFSRNEFYGNGEPKLQFFKEGGPTPPEGSPASRLSGSPSNCYPRYVQGAVKAVGGHGLPPPPMGGMPPPPPMGGTPGGAYSAAPGASPYAASSPCAGAMSPPAGVATFTVYGGDTPGGMTPGGYTPGGYTPGGATPGGPLVRNSSFNSSPKCLSMGRAPSGVGGATPGRGGVTPGSKFGNLPRPGDTTPGGTGVSSPSRRRTDPKKSSNSRIDPEQVPRPVGQPEAAKEEGGKVYETNKYHVPPAATAVCTVVDKGSSSCEFIRSTVNQVPAYPSTANTAHVPMAVICQPFTELTPQEEQIPCVDLGESGPFRCNRCKAYVSCFFTWHSNGKEATCNFCGSRVEVPLEYMCGLDERQQRRDKAERPELNRGTVDYVAPSDYSESMPTKPATFFVIEATQRSLQSGLLPQVMWTLRSLLGFIEGSSSKIGIMLFDQALHFFAFYPGLDCARQITVSDTEDPFAPGGAEALLVDAEDPMYRSQLDTLLENLPGLLCADGLADQAAGGAALKAATQLVGSRGGGHVIMFHALLPNTGIGALRHRDDLKLAAEPEGGGLFTVQQPAFFDEIGNDCLSSGVAVSVFCATAIGKYIDMATLSRVPRRTGGEICFYPGFDPSVDGEKLHYDLSRTVVQPSVYSVVFKLRVSKGLSVECMHATWDPEVIDPTTFAVSRMSVDATANFTLVHGERIEGQKHVYVQAAVLYTDKRGRRLIRVHTLQLPVTSSLSNVFRYTEIDTVTNLLIKQAANYALSGNGSFKDKLSKNCVDMLHAYRVNCASMTSAGQLILPESLKLLPLYIGSIRKMPAFRAGSDIKVDDRIVSLIRILGLPISLMAPLVYPRVYTMLPLPERAGLSTGVGDNVHLPPTIACQSDKLATDRIYLIDNGITLRIYVRPEVPQDVLYQTFGVHTMQEVAAVLSAPEDFEDSLSEDAERILACVQQIRRDRWRLPWQTLLIVLPGTPEESRTLATLMEDRAGSEANYVDFLCHIHKLVQNKQD